MEEYKLVVAIPCFNEAPTIRKVVADFKEQLPGAIICVVDNNSTDNSAKIAKEAGANVLFEKRQGKGFVIATIFRKICADFYVIVDGDDTYPADMVHDLLEPLFSGRADMVVGRRLNTFDKKAFRPFHITGNKLVCYLINVLFSAQLTDPMSGYRAFTREVALELPIVATGFDIETEMTVQLLVRNFTIIEKDIYYRERPQNSPSKLNTFRDGKKVLMRIFKLLVGYKPLLFFGFLSLASALLGSLFGYYPIAEYIRYQYVYSVPKAILASSLILFSVVSFSTGLISTLINNRLLEISSLIANRSADAHRDIGK